MKLSKENEELRDKFASSLGEGSYKDDFLNQIETISKLKLDNVLKQNEIDRLKAVEVQILKFKLNILLSRFAIQFLSCSKNLSS